MTGPAPMLIYDGDCGFCTSSAAWLRHRLPADVAVRPWQELDLGELHLTTADVTAAAYWIEADGSPRRGHLAIARALQTAGGMWRPVGLVISVPPVSWLAAGVYSVVARYRYKLPGSTEACRL